MSLFSQSPSLRLTQCFFWLVTSMLLYTAKCKHKHEIELCFCLVTSRCLIPEEQRKPLATEELARKCQPHHTYQTCERDICPSPFPTLAYILKCLHAHP